MAKMHQQTIQNLLKSASLYNPNDAKPIYTQILKSEPMNFEALKGRGDCSRLLGCYEEALIDLSQANDLNPIDETVRRNLGYCFAETGEFAKAISELTLAYLWMNASNQPDINKSEEMFIIILKLAELNSLVGKEAEAKRYFDEAAQFHPNDWRLFWKRGVALRRSQKLNDSVRELQRALGLQEKSDEIRIDLAETFREQRDVVRALSYLPKQKSVHSIMVEVHIFLDMWKIDVAEQLLKEIKSFQLKQWKDIEYVRLVTCKMGEQKILQKYSMKRESLDSSTTKQHFQQISESLAAAQKRFKEINKTMKDCKAIYASESGAQTISQLRNKIDSLEYVHSQKIAELTLKKKDSEAANSLLKSQVERLEIEKKEFANKIEQQKIQIEENKAIENELSILQCVICMENPRDTLVMPCLHFMFCNSCIQEHIKTSNQCPSCRQITTGQLTCRLEGNNNNNGKKRKRGSD